MIAKAKNLHNKGYSTIPPTHPPCSVNPRRLGRESYKGSREITCAWRRSARTRLCTHLCTHPVHTHKQRNWETSASYARSWCSYGAMRAKWLALSCGSLLFPCVLTVQLVRFTFNNMGHPLPPPLLPLFQHSSEARNIWLVMDSWRGLVDRPTFKATLSDGDRGCEERFNTHLSVHIDTWLSSRNVNINKKKVIFEKSYVYKYRMSQFWIYETWCLNCEWKINRSGERSSQLF